ncbi:MAG: 4-hydroxy-tetrahydrodipicolinate reductase [Deltaproteobacteria bacterium]|nr:4-hydroxy-tetrahydrodipicolinate reductase [Deltaproteobacteria bacterium]
MTRIVVTGAAGRMGGRIISLISETEDLKVCGAVESHGHPRLGEDAGTVAGCGPLGVPISDSLELALGDADVLIDFTWPDVTIANAAVCRKLGKAMVVGTTGLQADQRREIEQLAQSVPVVFAPNMSIGVNVCFQVLKDIVRTLGEGFDIEIVELHHNKKKDSPSGTAVRMGEIIADTLGRDYAQVANYHREGMCGERTKEEIGMQTVRGGDIVGEHTVYFIGMGERIELTHRAMNRDMFARGAIRAAAWLAGKGPGLFDMQDVLGLSAQSH